MRFLTRLLIWWRWPMAVMAGLLLVAMLLGGWFSLRVIIPMFPKCSGRMSSGLVYFQYQAEGLSGGKFELEYEKYGNGPHWSWWQFKFHVDEYRYKIVLAPLWVVAVPPASLATAGFWLRRRQRTPGECKACRHQLMGAAVCPECGRAASAS